MQVTTATGVVTRTYDVTLPYYTSCATTAPLPLIVLFHGDASNGATIRSQFALEQTVAAAGQQAIFVYPNGTDANVDPNGVDRGWDCYHDPGYYPYPYTPGQPVPADNGEASGNVDVDFFDTIVETFEAQYCVDTSQVYIGGFSNGGYFVNQLARWRSGIVNGAAAMSGAAPFGNYMDETPNPDSGASDWAPPYFCVAPTGEVPIIIVHGLADTTVNPCNANEEQSYWELDNMCSGSANNCTPYADSCTTSNLADPSTAPTTPYGTSGDCVASVGCGEPVVTCLIPGLHHSVWPEAPGVVWSFFSSL
jgi:poly(3-hydroxybutyrate) depolymerase